MTNHALSASIDRVISRVALAVRRSERFDCLVEKLREHTAPDIHELHALLASTLTRRMDAQRALVFLAMDSSEEGLAYLKSLDVELFVDEEVRAFVTLARAHRRILSQARVDASSRQSCGGCEC